MSVSDVERALKTSHLKGLDLGQASHHLEIHGPNQISMPKSRHPLLQFLDQFQQPLVYILLLAVGVTAALGEWVDASVIFGVVLVNAIIGFIQESRAGKAIEALTRMMHTRALVRRRGRQEMMDAVHLVPGDVVLLQPGDKVPADMRLFHQKNFRVDESPLTGESVPVGKQVQECPEETILAERRCLAFAGTMVTQGMAEGIVVTTGDRTETGRISHLIQQSTEISTPLTQKIAEFSRVLLWAILVLAVVTFGVGLMHGGKWSELFMTGVALAVGAIPEGLPAAVTITLAVGVSRMARSHAIIRKLPAVETLGSTTVICSDKTGTLTENQMTVQRIFAGGRLFQVGGTGYQPEGQIALENGVPVPTPSGEPALMECLKAGLLCNDAQLNRKENRWEIHGDPTEGALLVSAAKAGLVHAEVLEAHPRKDVIPFESDRMYMATLHAHPEPNRRVVYKKGSLERVLHRCSSMLDASGDEVPMDPSSVRAAAEAMAAVGLRVLAFAKATPPSEHESLEDRHVQEGLVFLGLQGMMDPPRPDAAEAVRVCHEAGIQVKMITGDHPITAQVIAGQLGIRGSTASGALPSVTTGEELDKVSEESLPSLAEETPVFARVAPEQKLRLVRALQSRGHIVAMTGDGVNDAPALRQANMGVAMGCSSTEVAKGAADMILLDDRFSTIKAAVEEGRGIFDNLTKFIVWTIPTNAAEALILLTAVVLGTALPIQPVQILWINMATALFLGLMLVFEPREPGLMKRVPRDPAAPILTFPLYMRTGLVTLLALIGAFGLFLLERRVLGSGIERAQTVVMNVVVLIETAYLFNCRSLLQSPFSIGFFKNRFVIAGSIGMVLAQLCMTHVPLMNRLFHTAPLDLEAWVRVGLVALSVGLVVELEKKLRLRFNPSQPRSIATR